MKELDAISEDDNSVFLIQIHLNWEGRKLSDNYGFDIANYIRTKTKSFAPIIFYSPIQQKYFEKKSEKEIKYKILFGRGSAFREAPFNQQELTELAESIEPLNKASLHDVATMLCDLKGIVIDKLNHDLKFDADIDTVIEKVSPYLSITQKRLIGLEKFAIEIKQCVEDKNQNDFQNAKLQFITICNQELTEDGKEKPLEKKVKHKVLVVDDLLEELNKVKKYLNDEYEVEVANTGEKAIQILKADSANKIVAVISDWRLFADAKQNYWQPLQGYEVLEFASETGIRSLFALTSQADFVVHQIRNLMGIRFSLFKKENLNTAEQWKVFSDVLFEACQHAVESRASILDAFPTWNKSWKERGVDQKSLKLQYIDYWNSIDRDSDLNINIESKVNDMWDYLMETKNPYLIGEEKFQDYKVSIKVLRLKKILVLRRIWFGLWFNYLAQGKSKEALTELVYMKIFGFPGEGSIPQRTLNLCIQLDKINKKFMLPEEVEWLTKKGLLG